jgi:TPR repeat protein
MIDEQGMTPEQRRDALLAMPGLDQKAKEALQFTITPEALEELAAKLTRLEDPTAPGRAAYEREDYKTAVLLWRPLAERGNIDAQFYLSSAYFIGNGVPQSFVLAHMWSNLAAAGSPAAQTSNSRDVAVKTRDMAFGLMTPEQVAEAQRLASEWKPVFP